MTIFDISWPISEKMTQYKNKKEVSIKATKEFVTDHVREHLVQLGTHSGTHIDAPAHFLQEGKTISGIALEKCIGKVFVVDCTNVVNSIMRSDLQDQVPQGVTRLLLKTTNSFLNEEAVFEKEFVSLDRSAAQWMVDQGIELVGIDYLGIEKADPSHATHTLLLSQEIVIVEGLRLKEVEAGWYELLCLPLSIPEAEATPARALLIKE